MAVRYKNPFSYRKKFKPNIRRPSDRQLSTEKKKKLYTDNWDEIRKKVYNRDGNRCVMCGRKGRLHAHHIVPVRISKDNSLTNLISVCESCHKKLEEIGFKILEHGGSRMDVRKAELTLLSEAKKKRLEKYQQKLEELKEKNNVGADSVGENIGEPENAVKSLIEDLNRVKNSEG